MGSAATPASDADMEDWEVFSQTETDFDSQTLVGTIGSNTLSNGLNVAIHPLASPGGVIVNVQTPQRSPGNGTHVPCDIVLVIDVSGSMSVEAPAPAYDDSGAVTKEHYGLSVLDLVKHAAHTIMATLNEGDRLGIVDFSDSANVVQTLTPMGERQKRETAVRINELKARTTTNLFAGILAGLGLFETERNTGRVPSILVLTDGLPNYLNPAQGFVPKLRSMSPLPAQIHTFGFGYDIKSGLLKSIADAFDGNYSFIPDSGMIGTVFVHAVAQLQTTYATRCMLEILAPAGVQMKLSEKSIDQDVLKATGKLTIRLGNLQYGQSRDIYLSIVDQTGRRAKFNALERTTPMKAKVTYSLMRQPCYVSTSERYLNEPTALPEIVGAYHQSRWMICEFLSSFFTLTQELAYESIPYDAAVFQARLKELVRTIPSASYKDDDLNNSIMKDVQGQITEALSKKDYYTRWGCHYFLSLWNAHAKQLCNSFKDAGPMKYNQNLFFIGCRDALDDAFTRLTPPTPSIAAKAVHRTPQFSMKKYNSAVGPCFSSESPVLLASGEKTVVGLLRRGMMVQTRLGCRKVMGVVMTGVVDAPMCQVRELLVTPWHPIRLDDAATTEETTNQWVFPMQQTNETTNYTGRICSVLLEEDDDSEGHTLQVGGVWCVTLGHGVLSGEDARAHAFLGDHEAVSRSMSELDHTGSGLYFTSGVKRDAKTGLMCGFQYTDPSNRLAVTAEGFAATNCSTTIAV
ncbi:U-box domain-containing protein [Xylariaceae sp. FL1019]|nr:U-box domain-containing protein [Xylariaceae sp. FL1019]